MKTEETMREWNMDQIKAIRHHSSCIDFHRRQLKKHLANLPPGEEEWRKEKPNA